MSGYAVECTGLAKSFGDVRAVDNLTLAVRAGEVVAVLGPSGCGKTTALRLIAGFERPDGGEIRIGGRVVAADDTCLPPERRRVGLVFQNYALFPHMTVAENVGYGIRRGPRRAARVREILRLVELDGLDARLPHELSGGQQQRVALARALAPQPDVLLMDEPFSNLDAGLRAQVRQEVKEILGVTHTTVLFVTHDQEEALLMGDRVAILHAGAVEQVGAPADVFHTPATRFVAGFLGVADFIPGQILARGVQTELGFVEQPPSALPGRPIEVMVRPHDVALYVDPDGNAVVVGREFRGAEHLYAVRLDSGRIVHSSQPHIVELPVGSRVRVVAEPGHSLVCFEGQGALPCAACDLPGIGCWLHKTAAD